ncbi:MAG: HlyD family efflux transporter periplasmic adaptor subunit, partial [Gammaproteobacteria bacterium]|nr:HlyD family efflux transporter periplasmic adaptor subunit [Gammaproteobacteria bacterium]
KSLLVTREEELKKGYVTRQQVEVTRTQIYSLEEEVRSSRGKIEEARIAFLEYENANHKTIRQIEQEIIATKNQLREEQREHKIDQSILSPIDGFVAEIDTELGAFVEANEQVAVIRRIGEDFQALSFFKIKDGKKIKPGMRANVSPTSVERDLYGSIIGNVVSVSVLPESEAGLHEALDNSILVQEMLSTGAVIRVVIELEEAPDTFSGLKWTSSDGPPVKISVATIANSSVTVREEAPINFVIPIFKAWVLEE